MADKNEPKAEPVYITLDRKDIEGVLKNHFERLDVAQGNIVASRVDVELRNGDFNEFNDTLSAYIKLTF